MSYYIILYKNPPEPNESSGGFYFFALIILKNESVSVRMEYITNSIFGKLMELFKNVYFLGIHFFGDKFGFTDASTSSCFPHPLCTNEY